jgi:hypothetical protein
MTSSPVAKPWGPAKVIVSAARSTTNAGEASKVWVLNVVVTWKRLSALEISSWPSVCSWTWTCTPAPSGCLVSRTP